MGGGHRHNNKVGDLYLRECFLEGNYRVLSGVRYFSKIVFLQLLWLLQRTLKCSKAWRRFPAKAWPGTGMRKCIHFWVRGISEVRIFRVLENRSNQCVKKKLMSCKIVNVSNPKIVARTSKQRDTPEVLKRNISVIFEHWKKAQFIFTIAGLLQN